MSEQSKTERLAEIEAEIESLTRPEVIGWSANSEVLRRLRSERAELRAALAAE